MTASHYCFPPRIAQGIGMRRGHVVAMRALKADGREVHAAAIFMSPSPAVRPTRKRALELHRRASQSPDLDQKDGRFVGMKRADAQGQLRSGNGPIYQRSAGT